MRHGYITIAVDWQTPHQFRYEYSLREHQTVLGVVRDAMRRFSIDTDRIFLTGHDIGGDAAWDIGLAHPDLWAGVVPYLAVSRRYVPRYRDNGKLVDWYFVAGERDAGKMVENAPDFDKYLRPGFNCTLVEYHGRGHEPYHDEIQRVFDWMNRRTRRAPPEEFSVSTMRPWDNYFWWMELAELPEGSMVPPASWPPKRGQRAATIEGRVHENSNKIAVRSGAKRTTIWLRPELVDFDKPITIEINGRRIGPRDRTIVPDLGVLLEDARTRCDRRNPYWAKVSTDDSL
jgi:predicted esterase